jgi:nicotinamidase-related amidase
MQVMIIDMLEGFTRLGPLASERINVLIPGQTAFLRALPPNSLIVFVGDEHDPQDSELKRFPPHCLRGTAEAKIRQELLEAAEQSHARIEIVRKHQFSGFINTSLGQIVETAPEQHWIVIGCVTDCCIEANIAELIYRGREVTVIRSLINTWNMTAEQARQLGLSDVYAHHADQINEFWFSYRLPAIWGVHVVKNWPEMFSKQDLLLSRKENTHAPTGHQR